MPRSQHTTGSRARPIVLAIGLLFAVGTASALGIPAPARGAAQAVTIADSAFGPTTLTVTVGDTVTWTNADSRPHTVTADGGQFDSGNLDSGASFSHTFAAPGTYTYACEYHGEMRATVVVEAAAEAPAGSTAGGAEAPPSTSATGDQPDTALPARGLESWVPTLLIGLGLLALAFGLLPLGGGRKPSVVPTGGWRR